MLILFCSLDIKSLKQELKDMISFVTNISFRLNQNLLQSLKILFQKVLTGNNLFPKNRVASSFCQNIHQKVPRRLSQHPITAAQFCFPIVLSGGLCPKP